MAVGLGTSVASLVELVAVVVGTGLDALAVADGNPPAVSGPAVGSGVIAGTDAGALGVAGRVG